MGTLIWLFAASKLHNDRTPCCTVKWPYCLSLYTVSDINNKTTVEYGSVSADSTNRGLNMARVGHARAVNIQTETIWLYKTTIRLEFG